MLVGLQTAAVEVAGFIAVGFVRPAIFALRGQIDLAAGWLYDKDHPLEWEHVVKTGEGFLQKGEKFQIFGNLTGPRFWSGSPY